MLFPNDSKGPAAHLIYFIWWFSSILTCSCSCLCFYGKKNNCDCQWLILSYVFVFHPWKNEAVLKACSEPSPSISSSASADKAHDNVTKSSWIEGSLCEGCLIGIFGSRIYISFCSDSGCQTVSHWFSLYFSKKKKAWEAWVTSVMCYVWRLKTEVYYLAFNKVSCLFY